MAKKTKDKADEKSPAPVSLKERVAAKIIKRAELDKKRESSLVKGYFERGRVSSGVYAVDKALDGLCFSYFYEWFGAQSSSKSTSAQRALGEVNNINYDTGLYDPFKTNPSGTLYIDLERTYDPAWSKKVGLDPELDVNDVEYIGGGDNVGDAVLDYINSDLYSGIVIDSVEAMFPAKVLEGEMEMNDQGLRARTLYKAIRKWNDALAKACHRNRGAIWRVPFVILLNQAQLKMMTMHPTTTTPGGNAPKFYAGARVQFGKRRIDNDKKVGYGLQNIVGEVIKSKLGSNVGKTFDYMMATRELDDLAAGQVDNAKTMLKDLKDYDLITKTKDGVEIFGETYRIQQDFKDKIYAEPEFEREVWFKLLEVVNK